MEQTTSVPEDELFDSEHRASSLDNRLNSLPEPACLSGWI